jgi:pimeloyl-ACP methyl ester carboxylesterase
MFDKRGTGLSDPFTGIATLEERSDDVRAVMDAVDSSSAFVCGLSEGGPMSVLFSATFPERTRGLILIGSNVRMLQMGDGMLAVFDGPARGVRCAEAVRAGAEELGVELRAGLHVGECELRGDDVDGLAVHIGARIAALASPGEIQVSRTVRDLVAGSGLRFAERGERELKGVPERWPLFSVAP